MKGTTSKRQRGSDGMPITSKNQSEAKQKWMKENSKVFGVRVMRNTEADIFAYLEDKVAAEEFKKGIRLLMAQEGFVYTPPAGSTNDEE